ncbi:MAG: Crp/Fnr family transcriptional regulator [Bacteroidales bacterium]|jgi:CRP/FNR family transcriptional regulator|nr:Crp/Fnr family transcriptional regulator [Bacteroidales bacterium]
MELSVKVNNCKDCIYRSWAFKNLSDDDLRLINNKKNERLYRKGEKICSENEPISSFMYLQNGLVKLYKTESNDREHIISIARPKDFIGLLSIFSNKTQVYSITAIEDSVVCFVDLEIIKNMIKTNGVFAIDFFEKISAVADSVIKTRIDINTRQLRGRIAYILLLFAKQIYNSPKFSLPISRKEVAELIDMSTENVIRVLSEFRKDKIIQIEGKEIEILDLKRLEKIYDLG